MTRVECKAIKDCPNDLMAGIALSLGLWSAVILGVLIAG